MSDCIFCRIVAGKAPARFIHCGENCSAFLDIHPLNPGHLLVVPNTHYARMKDLPESIAGEMFALANRIFTAVLESGLKCDGANFFLSDGEQAGQEVSHCHLHLAPRFKGDGVKAGFSKERSLKLSGAEMDEVKNRIVAALPK